MVRAVLLPKERMYRSPDDEARLVAEIGSAVPTVRSAAFTELYRRYSGRLYRYLRSCVADDADAEDLTAQVFTAALENLPHYHERGGLAAWLFRIARNKTADFYRRRRPQLSLEEADLYPGTGPDPLDEVERAQALETLARRLRELPGDQAELLRLRYAADLSFDEIGALLGRNPAAVKMALHRLLRKLQAKWE
jgi:RNA polymerase sigma-70 factor (ECF subfamily)